MFSHFFDRNCFSLLPCVHALSWKTKFASLYLFLGSPLLCAVTAIWLINISITIEKYLVQPTPVACSPATRFTVHILWSSVEFWSAVFYSAWSVPKWKNVSFGFFAFQSFQSPAILAFCSRKNFKLYENATFEECY